MPTPRTFTFDVDRHGNVTPTGAIGPAYVNDYVQITGAYNGDVYANNNGNQCQTFLGVNKMTTGNSYKIISETANTVAYSISTNINNKSNGTLNVGSA